MFFRQIRRSAAGNRKGNGLFFGSLVVAIAAFYTLLSLKEQDVMRFLAGIESDAVRKLLMMIPMVYAVSLFFVFFLVYFACRYQIDSRRRELGMYLMLGMRRSRLFLMLFCETLWSSMISLLIGLPLALFLTEGISLATARIVGLGILGHRFSLSPEAVLWTVCGFILVQLLSMLILCVSLGRTEPAELFRSGDPKKQSVPSGAKSSLFFYPGLICLLLACWLGIFRLGTLDPAVMFLILLLGISGTFLFYRGLGGFLGGRIRRKNSGAPGLLTFTFRQVQENVLSQHSSLAVSSLLLIMALSCISYGIAMGLSGTVSSRSVDFSLFGEEEQIDDVLARDGIHEKVGSCFPLYLSHVKSGYYTGEEYAFDTRALEEALSHIEGTDNILENLHIDYVIAQSSYNRILEAMGKGTIDLSGGKTALYSSMAGEGDFGILIQKALEENVSIGADGKDYALLPRLYSDNVVADRAITLYLGWIVPDELYSRLAGETVPYCRNVRLRDELVEEEGLMQAVRDMNGQLAETGIEYDSYLGGIGRNLFYTVAAGYLTIYLGTLFWLISNTVIGMKYLIGQRRTKRRYETLCMLGADAASMKGSVKKQISVYFALVLVPALFCSAAAILTMFTSFARLPAGVSAGKTAALSAAALISFAILEILYIRAVKRAACREIGELTVRDPERVL